jgi:multidrug efflux pump subunit AcrA (membrane-fusion protein)
MSSRSEVTSPVILPQTSAMRMVRSAPTTRLLGRILGGLLVAFVLVMMFAPWVQNTQGTGRVIAYAPLERQQLVEAPVDGRINHWYVQEGSRVEAGDPIVDIVDNDPAILVRLREERDAVNARIQAAKNRQTRISNRITALEASRESAISAANSRVRMANERETAAERAVAAAEALEVATAANIERQKELESRGLASRRTLELADVDHARAVTEVDRARASLRAAESDVLAIQSDALKVKADTEALVEDAEAQLAVAKAEEASAAGELARLEVRLARQTSQAVTAPRSGVVLRLIANQGGEQVKAGDSLAVLVPDTEERAVELWIDGNDMPLVHEGRQVRLQFEGWPAVQFSGWPSVAVGTFGGRVALVDATDNGKGKFRVLILPDEGEAWPSGAYLRQGVRANGWVLMETVPLGWELWRQFNGFPPTLSEPPTLDTNAKAGKSDAKK